MTTAELKGLMGDPYNVTSRQTGEVWVWSQANGFTGANQSISFIVKDGVVISVPVIPEHFK
jgi:hypothetical protein